MKNSPVAPQPAAQTFKHPRAPQWSAVILDEGALSGTALHKRGLAVQKVLLYGIMWQEETARCSNMKNGGNVNFTNGLDKPIFLCENIIC